MIREITCADIFRDPNAAQLLSEYAAECSIPAIGHINPQPDMYDAMEKAHILKCFGAYEDERLVGFCTLLTVVLPHYGKRVAMVESLFVTKQSTAGSDLLLAVEAFAARSGYLEIMYSVPVGGRLEKLMSLKKSCTRTNTVFCRRLI
jgi:hypothetical protein